MPLLSFDILLFIYGTHPGDLSSPLSLSVFLSLPPSSPQSFSISSRTLPVIAASSAIRAKPVETRGGINARHPVSTAIRFKTEAGAAYMHISEASDSTRETGADLLRADRRIQRDKSRPGETNHSARPIDAIYPRRSLVSAT